MKTCETCGNDIPDSASRCPFCESQQQPVTFKTTHSPLRTLNIKEGMPLVDEALADLERDLANARLSGVRLIRLIHGYGSTGTGGKLREACRAYLARKLTARQIRRFIPGEDYSKATNAGRDLLGRFPELRNSEVSDRQNPGITFVEL
jgi:hypothetical protein